jgi:hypothetical protein
LIIQTKGPAPGSSSAAELKIDGITEPEILREFIKMQMQERTSNAAEGIKTSSVDEKILEELVAVRSLLGEKQS